MESGETDWSSVEATGAKADVDSSSDVHLKQDVPGLTDMQSEHMYDSSNLGGEDDYMNSLGLYDGYDSYNDSGGTTEEDDRFDSSLASPASSQSQNSKAAALLRKSVRYVNGKDGMATCEQCGSVGVRHAFYSKSKRFCSLSCSRSFATAQREGRQDSPLSPPVPKKGKPSPGGRKSKSQVSGWQKLGMKQDVKEFDWGTYLITNLAPAAPVSFFPHVPMNDSWDQIAVGMKVEVANVDCDLSYPVYWIASVVKVAGFTALMRYEGYGSDASRDFWVSLVSPDIHPVGWCATIGKPLVPPQSIQNRYNDWKEFLVKRLTGSRTLPGDFHQMFQDSVKAHKFRKGMRVEVVNKIGVSTMKVAVVSEVVGGRLRLKYADSKDEDEFWCHMRSPLIHYVGWSVSVGHALDASAEYRHSCLNKLTTHKYSEDDASPDMVPKLKEPPHGLMFSVGMKLEAIDPLNLSSICVATVMKVLRNNYLMIGIDGALMPETGADWFCYHSTSPYIFPVGFCEINNIDLTPPKGHKGAFKWFDYLKQTKSVAAPVKLFDKEIPKHGFRPGMKIEAVDLMEPRLICVATITRIVGRLLRIHFDGWENEYDQWVDCQSPDIYPVGWCQAMNYTLEGPRIKENVTPVPMMQKKKKTKNQIYKGPRKKRKSKPGLSGNPFPPGYRFLSSSVNDSREKYRASPAEKGGDVRPPHVPLPPEAVAANLPPLLDADLMQTTKIGKVEPASPMETSATTPATPSTQSQQQQPGDSLPTLSPKGGSVPDPGNAPLLPNSVKREPLDTAVTASGGSSTLHSASNSSSSGREVNGSDGQQGGVVAKLDRPASSASLGNTSGQVCVGSGSGSVLSFTPSLQGRPPHEWSAQDVCLFLSVNDCGGCSETVLRKNLGGRELLALSAEEEISLAGTKVGPSLRITQLLQQLRSYVSSLPSNASATKPVSAPAPMDMD